MKSVCKQLSYKPVGIVMKCPATSDYYDTGFMEDIRKNVSFEKIKTKIKNTVFSPNSYYLKLIGSGWCTYLYDKHFIWSYEECDDWSSTNNADYFREGFKVLKARKKCNEVLFVDLSPMEDYYSDMTNLNEIEMQDFKTFQ
jgi:hypothetical protein